MDDAALWDCFLRLHSGLGREAPGSAAATLRALQIAAPPENARVLELGCGPGAAVEALLGARGDIHVTGLDLHAPYVAEAAKRAEAMGARTRFTGVVADMSAPPLSGPFETIWCEGAAYAIGVEAALRAWAPLLVPGGCVALSEAVWLTAEPDPRARAVFAEYPGMADLATLRARVVAAGYEPVSAFELGAEEWDNYYLPLAARCDALEDEFSATEEGRHVLDVTREEIAARGAAGRDYGYVFIVARKP
ncbi:SAM-dependent methyltransferase [Rhodovulum sp. DZ06]|uniref:SAM-dependent methyltransferase n=1 Tax=Rhodovulum sp. DZ06 TaxID=3425126 RepID=UPI003D34649C